VVSLVEVRIPDLGDAKDVGVVEVLTAAGSRSSVDDPLVTLETEKASMDVPSPVGGRFASIAIKKGDIVTSGTLIGVVEVTAPLPLPRLQPPRRRGAGRGGECGCRGIRRTGCERCAAGGARSRGSRRRTGRLHGGVPGGRFGNEGDADRALADARRRVPERRLYSLEGAAARRQGHRGGR
jgi:pyruvate/2-oxoglutarate dehydrogenase complex dihydrolipoamide acyltransferase (E2) component